jgi:hypothetical protein
VTDARITQVSVEVTFDANPDLRVTQTGADAVFDANPDLRTTQLAMEIIWAPHVIETPPIADLEGIGYADLLLHIPYVIDEAGDQVVAGGTDDIIDLAGDTVIDLAGDGVTDAPADVIAIPYWT